VVDRRGGPVLLWAGSLLAAGSLCIAMLAVQLRTPYVVAGVAAFALAWGWPGLFNLAIVWFVPAEPALATGIAMTGMYLGGVIGPPLFGLVVEHQSYAWAWGMAAGWALAAGVVMCLAMLLAPDRRPRHA
jgi:MFS family permease